MVFKIRLKIDPESLKESLIHKRNLISHNIEKVFREEALPHLVNLIMLGFDDLGARANLLPTDPTNPDNWRQEFEESLWRDIEESITIKSAGGLDKIEVGIGNKDFLGYGREEDKSSTPLIWLVYFLEGLAGEWGFVTSNMVGGKDFGRFGEGFMISREQYHNEGWHRRTGISFEQIRHPFSEYSPKDIFIEALYEFDLKSFIAKAIRAASQEIRL